MGLRLGFQAAAWILTYPCLGAWMRNTAEGIGSFGLWLRPG